MVSWVAALVLPLGLVAANAEQLVWQSNYGTALKQAKAEGKPLLVILENPEDDQHRITQVSHSETTSTDLLKPYVLCRVDVRTEYGERVAKAFKAEQFPHTSIIDKTGEVQIFKKSGPFTTAEWEGTLTAYKAGNRKSSSASSFEYYGGGGCPSCRRR